MDEIRWEFYPLVAMNVHGRHWLTMQSQLQLAPKTLYAYGRSLNDFLAFCQRLEVEPSTIAREQVALYVQDLAQRPNPKGAKVLSIESGRGLSNATMHQRITVLRLFCDSLVERQLRQDNPVGRGHYVPGKAFGGVRARGLLPRYQKLPWLPFRCCEKRKKKRGSEAVAVYSTLCFSFCTYLTIPKKRVER